MNTQIVPLIEQAVMERMRAKTGFTTLDISNALKADRYPIRHGEVAEVVRDIYASGAMGFYDFDRRLIDVVTEGGEKQTQAFLYLHSSTREREYTARHQTALPPVAPAAARDLADCVPAGPLPALPRPVRASRSRGGQSSRRSQRRDGALAVPRTLISQLGWAIGKMLGLTVDAGRVRLTPNGEIPVQVWGGQRVRICKRKLRLCGLLKIDTLSVSSDGEGLRIEEG